MQLITTKSLLPLPPKIIKRYTLRAEALKLKRKKNGYATGDQDVGVKMRTKYCPSMDLIATFPVFEFFTISDEDEGVEGEGEDESAQRQSDPYGEDEEVVQVDVWRLNGQKVFSIGLETDGGYESSGAEVDVVDVSWRSDGQILAVLSSDCEVRLVNVFNGKVVHRFAAASSTATTTAAVGVGGGRSGKESKVLGLSYTTHFSTPRSTWSQLEKSHQDKGLVLDDLLALNADVRKLLKAQADLPRELASIDVENYMPRLACLPPVGFGLEDLFSTRASVDAIFHSAKRNVKNGSVDVLAAGTSDGRVHIRIFDSFEVGDVDLSAATGSPNGVTCDKVVSFSGQPFSNELLTVVAYKKPDASRQLHLLDMDLRFITHSSSTLPVLATKATQLQNLLRYLTQIQTQLAREVKTSFDLPTRFLRTLNEDLVEQEGAGSSFTTAAHNALVTGEVGAVFKEWLSETLGDRGVKRWEKAVGDCLELIRRLVSEGWNPAVERSGVVVSRLTGLAGLNQQSEDEGKTFGIDRRTLEALRETISVMTICGEDLLRETNREITGFGGFVKWLKWEVEAAGLEDTSERLDEMREGSDHDGVLQVLEYIESGPADSMIKNYIGEASRAVSGSGEDDIGFYNRFRDNRRRSSGPAQTPTFSDLLGRMQRQCDKVFEQIAQTLRDSILTSHLCALPEQLHQQMLRIRTVPQPEHGRPIVYIVGRHHEKVNEIVFVSLRLDAVPPPNRPVSTTSLQAPGARTVLDVQFVDDSAFLILTENIDGVFIHSHSVEGALPSPADWQQRHHFPGGTMEAGMKPSRLEINGRKGRRAVSVVDAEGRGYSVFDLDTVSAGDDDDDDDDEKMTG